MVRKNESQLIFEAPSCPEFTLWTDASGYGYGAVLFHRLSGHIAWHAGPWSDEEKLLHINVLEMMALQRASDFFADQIGSSPVLIMIDNTSVKFSIRKRFSPSLPLNVALQKCAASLRKIRITEIRYVASANNLADIPSRGGVPDFTAVDQFLLHCSDTGSGSV